MKSAASSVMALSRSRLGTDSPSFRTSSGCDTMARMRKQRSFAHGSAGRSTAQNPPSVALKR